jgi:hypothetical protein
MAIITTGSFAKALWPGINAWYGMQYDEHRVEYTDLFKTESSDKAYEEEVAVSGFGLAPKKAEAAGISYDTARQLFVKRYTNVTYGLGFIITREMYEDDLYSVIGKQRSRSLAFSMRQTKETVAGNIFNRAFNSSYTGGDGLELCSTAHVTAGATFSNITNPASDLSTAALEQAAIDIMDFRDNRGLKISVQPRCLVVPTALAFEAQRILKSSLEHDTANNAINALKSMNVFPDGIKVNHYFTDANNWFILTTVPDGLKYFERRADDFSPGENDFDTENARYKATARYVFGWTDPRAVFGSAPA